FALDIVSIEIGIRALCIVCSEFLFANIDDLLTVGAPNHIFRTSEWLLRGEVRLISHDVNRLTNYAVLIACIKNVGKLPIKPSVSMAIIQRIENVGIGFLKILILIGALHFLQGYFLRE